MGCTGLDLTRVFWCLSIYARNQQISGVLLWKACPPPSPLPVEIVCMQENSYYSIYSKGKISKNAIKSNGNIALRSLIRVMCIC